VTTKSMNGTAHNQHVEPTVTDLDLMLYLDGELEAERHEEVRQAISSSKVLRSKLAALDIASDIVSEQALGAAANIEFADAVMARIAADEQITLDARDVAPGSKISEIVAADNAPVRLDKLGQKSSASNDNARGIFALAAFAVAAAAGLMIWGRVAPSFSTTSSEPMAMTTTAEVAPVVAVPAPAAEPMIDTVAAAGEEQEEVGVEVAAVDFGSKVGTIFYVPSDAVNSKHTTTVVWLTDTDGEEK
jgi:hypothetical protein